MSKMELTDIQKFYKNKTVFITGATGFIGKTLTEKLLRSCSELHKIIVPIRIKKNQTIENRVFSFFNNKLWDKLRAHMPDFTQKIIFISSNLEKENFEMTSEDYKFVVNTVNIIFHSAATVHFNAPLKESVNSNVRITRNLLNIAKEMTQLEVLIHVSTLWSHFIFNYTDEEVKKSSFDPDFLISLVDNLDDILIKKIEDTILESWPSTYAFTKHMSENLVCAEKGNLPLTIVRIPGITCIYKEPIPGWINDMQILSTMGLNIMLGIMKVSSCNPDVKLNILPADLTVNCLIAVAWYSAVQKSDEVKVYNDNCGNNFMTINDLLQGFVHTKYPLEEAVSKPSCISVTSKVAYDRWHWWYEVIPARIYDFLTGQNKFQKVVHRNKLMNEVFTKHCTTYLHHEYKNIPELWEKLCAEDQQLFNFNSDIINWKEYMDVYCKGVKQYFNDGDNLKNNQCGRYM